MKDLRIIFNGGASTIDLQQEVENKDLYVQKVLINMVTVKGSDPIYEERGTDLLADSINGKVYSRSGAMHVGNFAALDTIYFIRSQNPDYVTTEPYIVRDVDVDGIAYNNKNHSLSMSVQVSFADDTSTEAVADLPALS